MRRVYWTHDGFHGTNYLSAMVPADARPGDLHTVSARVARRLNGEVCGTADCRCGEHVVIDGDMLVVPRQGATWRGNYPKRDGMWVAGTD